MNTEIKDLFEEIPEFDDKDAAKILYENSDKIMDELLRISSTTLDSEEESGAQAALTELVHTHNQNIKQWCNESYADWLIDSTDEKWQEYKKHFELGKKLLKNHISSYLD